MKIIGISMIRNDADIVEAFVRHTLRALDHLFVIVHCPHDGTGEILAALQAEGLPITLVLDDEPAFLQGERLSWLAQAAYKAIRCDFAFPLDADEFIVPPEHDAIEAALGSLLPDALAGGIRLRTFVPTSDDPADEPHPLRRIRYHARSEDNILLLRGNYSQRSDSRHDRAADSRVVSRPDRPSTRCRRFRLRPDAGTGAAALCSPHAHRSLLHSRAFH